MRLFLVRVFIACQLFYFDAASRYEVIIERVENALGSEDRAVSMKTLRVKKFNRTTHVVDGEFDLLIDLDNSISISVNALNFQGNQYKLMFSKELGKYCDALYQPHLKKQYEKIQMHTIAKFPWKTCPWTRGVNGLKNFRLEDTENFLPPYIPGNEKWEFQLRFSKDEEVLGGYNAYVIIRDEVSLLEG